MQDALGTKNRMYGIIQDLENNECLIYLFGY